MKEFLRLALLRYAELCVRSWLARALTAIAVFGVLVVGPIALLSWGWLHYRETKTFAVALDVLLLCWGLAMLAQAPKDTDALKTNPPD